MPTYEITSPEGKTFEVTAPEGASQDDVLAYAKKNMVQAVQAAAPKAAAPALKPDQGLGFRSGVVGTVNKLAGRADEALQRVGVPMDAINRGLGLPTAREAMAADKGALADAAAKGRAPGGIGEFIGKTAVELPGYALGPVAGGAIQGLAESDAAPGDYHGLAKDTAFGAVTGKVGDVVGGAVTKRVGDAVAKQAAKINPAKLVSKLQTAKTAAYDQMRNLGITYTPQAVQRLQGELASAMQQFRANRADHGPAFEFMQSVADDIAEGRFHMEDVDKMRSRVYRDVASKVNPDDAPTATLGKNLGKVLTDFMEQTQPGDMQAMRGQGLKAATDLNEQGKLALGAARQANRKFKNVERVNDLMRSSTLKAAATYSGGNIDNRTRQSLRPLVDPTSGKNIEHFLSPEESGLLTKTVEGTPGQNAMRSYGRMSPLSGGLTALMNVGTTLSGAAAGGPHALALGAAHMLASSASKLKADSITKGRVKDLIELMAAGGTQKAMLAERQLRTLAAKNSNVGKWLDAALKDASELGTMAAVRGQGDARRKPAVTVESIQRPDGSYVQ